MEIPLKFGFVRFQKRHQFPPNQLPLPHINEPQ